MNKEIATYNLSQFEVCSANNLELLVRDLEGQVVAKHALGSEPLYLRVSGENGSKSLKIGHGKLGDEFFSRAYRPESAEESFRVVDSDGIGTGDLRDGLRIVLQYDLSQVCIALAWDGIYLQIHCPGNPQNGDLPWFTETSGN